MKTVLKFLLLSLIILQSCKDSNTKTISEYAIAETPKTEIKLKPAQQLSKEFNDYWYAGEAEISSYKLEQARYGEIRDGNAVLVFVTEPFLQKEQVKADRNLASNVPVLKLNSTKNFNTGVYPYSIMQSAFYPISNNEHAIKVSASIQEWCGHTYLQLNNREQFEINAHSYFESEADEKFNIEKAVLENELWTQLRINPKSLPVGKFKVIPSLEFIRLKHKKLKGYNASAELKNNTYTINYSELNRKLSITFSPNFPHTIESWEEIVNGLTTKATKLKTIKSAYWSKNRNKDQVLRKTLLLEN